MQKKVVTSSNKNVSEKIIKIEKKIGIDHIRNNQNGKLEMIIPKTTILLSCIFWAHV